jgi:hypothetical protein
MQGTSQLNCGLARLLRAATGLHNSSSLTPHASTKRLQLQLQQFLWARACRFQAHAAWACQGLPPEPRDRSGSLFAQLQLAGAVPQDPEVEAAVPSCSSAAPTCWCRGQRPLRTPTMPMDNFLTPCRFAPALWLLLTYGIAGGPQHLLAMKVTA